MTEKFFNNYNIEAIQVTHDVSLYRNQPSRYRVALNNGLLNDAQSKYYAVSQVIIVR